MHDTKKVIYFLRIDKSGTTMLPPSKPTATVSKLHVVDQARFRLGFRVVSNV